MKRFIQSAIAVGAAALVWISCTTVPETGRTQFNLLSVQQERQMGVEAFEQMKKEMKISDDAAKKALVEKVGRRIAEVVQDEMPNAEWEFVVFESEQANAFALPGGKVGIYTGILPITKNEGGLATVMGHEVAHAVARHGGARVSRAMAIQAGGELIGAAMSESKEEYQKAVSMAYGVGAQVGVALPHTRKQEAEADKLGLLYMARAGYNPEAAVAFWQRFAEYSQKQGGKPLGF